LKPPIRLDRRSAGILLHPTSLPGPYGIGDLGPEAHRFADRLESAGQTWWQVLPVAPPDKVGSPYHSVSAFAGSPLMVSPEGLYLRGLLSRAELAEARDPSNGKRVRYGEAARRRERTLRSAFALSGSSIGHALRAQPIGSSVLPDLEVGRRLTRSRSVITIPAVSIS